MCIKLCISSVLFIFQAVYVWSCACALSNRVDTPFLLMHVSFFAFPASDFCFLFAWKLLFLVYLFVFIYREAVVVISVAGHCVVLALRYKEIVLFLTVNYSSDCCTYVSLWEGCRGNWQLCARIFVMAVSERPRNSCSVSCHSFALAICHCGCDLVSWIPIFIICDNRGPISTQYAMLFVL